MIVVIEMEQLEKVLRPLPEIETKSINRDNQSISTVHSCAFSSLRDSLIFDSIDMNRMNYSSQYSILQ